MPSSRSNSRGRSWFQNSRSVSSASPPLQSPPLRSPPTQYHAVPEDEVADSPRPSIHSRNSSHMRGIRRFEARRGLEESHYLASKARRKLSSSSLDMRTLDYISSCDSNLMCPICRCPFVDPIVLYDCDHCFCRDCLQKAWSHSASGSRGGCPTCRASPKLGMNIEAPKILVNILDDLVVKCPKHEDGCRVDLKRGEVSDHLDIYCPWAWVPCPEATCGLSVRRRDARTMCPHCPVSCFDCHEAMTVIQLETHWKTQCADRKVFCAACQSHILPVDYEMHTKSTCPATNVSCPGAAYGCVVNSTSAIVNDHAKSCTFATLAPFLEAQKKRAEEQDSKQAVLERKLQILEGGFESIQKIVAPRVSNRPSAPTAESSDQRRQSRAIQSQPSDLLPDDLEFPATPSRRPHARPEVLGNASDANHAAGFASMTAFPRPTTPIQDNDFEFSQFPGTSRQDPYASPAHHLLSLHENLREEVNRVTQALQELDGRHSMLILNESLRLKEDMAYLGGQVSGVARQVGWLTSTRLQEYQSRSGTPSSAAERRDKAQNEGSQSVMDATTSTAVRGAARVMNVVREGGSMTRRPTDEGRTKL